MKQPQDNYQVSGKQLICHKATIWEKDQAIVLNEAAYQKAVAASCTTFVVDIYGRGATPGQSGGFLCTKQFDLNMVANIVPHTNKFYECGRKIPISSAMPTTPSIPKTQTSTNDDLIESIIKAIHKKVEEVAGAYKEDLLREIRRKL
jgi:hypothetical protein